MCERLCGGKARFIALHIEHLDDVAGVIGVILVERKPACHTQELIERDPR
jgi:hypothetical protein